MPEIAGNPSSDWWNDAKKYASVGSYGKENAKHVDIGYFLGQSRIDTRSQLFGVDEMERGGVGNELHVKV